MLNINEIIIIPEDTVINVSQLFFNTDLFITISQIDHFMKKIKQKTY